MPALLRSLRSVLVLGVGLVVLTGATPQYVGIWAIEDRDGVSVSFPAADVPGATIRVANGAGRARVSTAFNDNPFDGVRLTARTAFDPLLVHAELLVDGERVAALDEPGVAERELDLPAGGHVLTLVVQTGDAPPKGWSVELVGITFRRGGYDVSYSHDCAGLDARVAGGLRFAVDPDWAELGWPLAGSVGVSRARPEGAERLSYTLRPALPAGLFRLRVGVDGEPLALYEPDDEDDVTAAFPLESGARNIELSMAIVSSVPGQPGWQAAFDDLAFDEPPAPAEVVAPPSTTSGCSTAPRATAAALVLFFLALLILRRRPS